MVLMSGCVSPLSESRAKSLGTVLADSRTINAYCLVGKGFSRPTANSHRIVDYDDFTPQVARHFFAKVRELRTTYNLDCHQVYRNKWTDLWKDELVPWVDRLNISDIRREFGTGLVLAFETRKWTIVGLVWPSMILGIRATLLDLEDSHTVWTAECRADEAASYKDTDLEARTVIGNRLAVECATQLANHFREASRSVKQDE